MADVDVVLFENQILALSDFLWEAIGDDEPVRGL